MCMCAGVIEVGLLAGLFFWLRRLLKGHNGIQK
jgi:hypothetical protein